MYFVHAVGLVVAVLGHFCQFYDAFFARFFIRIQHPQHLGLELVAGVTAHDDADLTIGHLNNFSGWIDADHARKAAHNIFIEMAVDGFQQDTQRRQAGFTFAVNAVAINRVIAVGYRNDLGEIRNLAGIQAARVALAIHALMVGVGDVDRGGSDLLVTHQ